MAQLDTKQKIRKKRLRSIFQVLGYEDVEAMIKRLNFFENSFNKSGSFKNYLEVINSNGTLVVIDHKTGLMWHKAGAPKPMNFDKARKWLASLKSKRYAGFSNWRFPTLEEAASLLEQSKNKNGLHIDPTFTGSQRHTWTGDRFGSTKRWGVRFNEGIVYGYSMRKKLSLRPVRKVK